MNPGARTYGREVDPPRYQWPKYESFLMSGQGSHLPFFGAEFPNGKNYVFFPVPDETFPIWPSPFGPRKFKWFWLQMGWKCSKQRNYFQQNRLQGWSFSLEQRTAAFRLDRPSCFVTSALLGTVFFCIPFYSSVCGLLPFPRRTCRANSISSSNIIVVNYIWSNILPRKNRAVRLGIATKYWRISRFCASYLG